MRFLSISLFLLGSFGFITLSSYQSYDEFFRSCVNVFMLIWGMNGIITDYNLDKLKYFKNNSGRLYVLFMMLVFILYCIYSFIFGTH